MANPELERAFDENGTNIETIPESKITDGYQVEEVLSSASFNTYLKQLYAAANKNRNDGVWDWEDPTVNDTEYNSGSITKYNNNIYISLIDSNTDIPTSSTWSVFLKPVETIAQMEALSVNDGDVCLVKDLDRGGTFIYDSTKVAEDNQGTNFNGWVRQYSGLVNVKWFGAKGNWNGTVGNDDTTYIQNALNVVGVSGQKLYFPNGRYKITAGLSLNISQGTDIREQYKPSIYGDSEGSSVIDWKGTGGGVPALKVYSTVLSGNVDFEMKSIKIVGYNRDVDGLELQDLSWASISNVTAHGFDKGLKLRDVISTTFTNCNFNANIRNVDAIKADTFNPNALSFYNCTIGTAKEFGFYIEGLNLINLYGGSFENNGVDSVTYSERGGIKARFAGAAGGIGLNCNGVYFEKNEGLADIIIEAGGNSSINNIIGCTFNRVDTTFATNHIHLKHDAGDGETITNIIGSSFKYFGTYTPDISRLYWTNSGTGTINYFNTLNNYYQSAIEAPNTAIQSINASVPNTIYEDNDGSYCEIQANGGVLDIRADQGNSLSGSQINFQIDGTVQGYVIPAGIMNINSSYRVAGTKVVGTQGAAISNSVGGDEVTKINEILSALRTHGLIAT